jgi:hypothetical protein
MLACRRPTVAIRSRSRHFALALWSTAVVSLTLLLAAAPANAVVSGSFGLQTRSSLKSLKEAGAVKIEPLQYHSGPVLHSSDAYAIYWDPTETYRFDWKELIDGYFSNVGAASGGIGDVFAVNSQYRDGGGHAANQSTYRGSYTVADPYPPSGCGEPATFACLTDEQVRVELQKVIASGALPGATGPAVYYLLTPPGVTVCTGGGSPSTCSNSTALKTEPETGICGYHSVINPGGPAPIVYAVQPWVAGNAGQLIESISPLETSKPTQDVRNCQDGSAILEEPNKAPGADRWSTYAQGLADVIINDLSIEQSNVVVNPQLSGWYQPSGAEQGDLCKGNFGPPPETPPTPDPKSHAAGLSNEPINGGSYYVQWGFDSVGLTSSWGYYCWQAVALLPHFTSANPVNSGDVVGFDGSESEVTLNANTKGLPGNEPYTGPVYSWNFGDGSSTVVTTNAASAFHSYKYGGTYTVTLTITDSGTNTASTSNAITVVGPSPPLPAQRAAEVASNAQSSSTSSSTSGAAAVAAAKPIVNPSATASIASRSLRNVLRGGLVVRYSVNEKVTGRFEVLLATSVARRIGLHGTPATGLAKGTAAQTIIGKAILVATAAGRNTVKIQFSKATAALMRRLHNASLMLRLVVRNASAGTTTVLSTIALSG